jgi:acyl-CoA synthetase (AMP-forming)/AMP-acid ligase II
MRLSDIFDEACDKSPKSVAVEHNDRKWTYDEIQYLSRKVANQLMIDCGLAAGARIACYMPNDPMFFVCQIGIHRTPYVWLPLSSRASVFENIDIMKAFDAEFLFFHSAFERDIPSIKQELPQIKYFVCVDRGAAGCMSLFDWVTSASDAKHLYAYPPNGLATLLTTGGSTGRPKGVMRTNVNWVTMVNNYRTALPYKSTPHYLATTPLTHAGGDVALSVFSQNGRQVIPPDLRPATILDCFERHGISSVFMPPTLIYMLLSDETVRDHDYSALQYLMYGAAPMSLDKLEEAHSIFGPVMTHLYGLTEVTSTATMMHPREQEASRRNNPNRLRSCGRAGPFSTVEIMGPKGSLVAPGEVGQVVFRGDTTMLGYFDDEAATDAALKDGWFYTGDIGLKDDDGYLYLVDRVKDVIITGGFNVYPSEVEQVIWKHPSVQDCAVVGVPDEKWGEAVSAVVELRPGRDLDIDELKAECRKQLGGVKAPKNIFIWETLPRSNVGKVLKKEIRQTFWEGSGRAI